jgi:drug/metabolite transporter (DMT)-like permease
VHSALAILVAAAAASLYALSVTMQALEAREAPERDALRSSLLFGLVRGRTWLIGSAVGGAGWGMQAAALALASVDLVQPALGLGLAVQLVLGVRILGERVGRRELGGVLTVVVGVGVLGWAAPSGIDQFSQNAKIGAAAAAAILVAAPYLLRFAHLDGGLVLSVLAGLGWAWAGIGTALIDRGLAHGNLLAALPWAVGVGLVSWASLVIEMSAFQKWPVTRSFPLLFTLEMAVPAAVAPLLTHGGVGPAHGIPFALALLIACAGAVVLGSSRAVARAVSA